MGVEGIGARVPRKEDKRFITGRGRYTDDMSVAGMRYAAFVRSPHAHARIGGIDTAAAKAMPGVVGVLIGSELAADKRRQPDLRLDDQVQGRQPDEHGRLPGAGEGRRAFRRPGRRGGRRGDARAGARRRRRRRGRLAGASRRSSIPAKAIAAGAGQLHPRSRRATSSTTGSSATAPRPTQRSPRPTHVTKLDIVNNRLVPNAMEPRAALGVYDIRRRTISRCGRPARTRTSRGSCSPPSTTSRRSTSCASSRRMSAAASAQRSSSIRKRSSASGRRRRPACR